MRLLFLIIILSVKLSAQNKDNYIKYFILCNEANQLYNNREFNAALNKYDSAFRLVHYQHVSNLLNAAVAAVKANQNKNAISYLRQAILNGAPISELNGKFFKELSELKPFMKLKDSAEILRNKFLTRINLKYAKQADSLFYIDQVVIRNVKVSHPAYKINLYVYASERQKYDSVNFHHLIKLIDKYGFPSEENIGPASYEAIKLVIHHSARMPANKNKIEYFKSEVYQGKYLPVDFAWMYDQLKTNSNETPFFYFQVGDASKLTEEEKNQVDKNRRDFGIRPLNDDKLIRIY